MPLRSINNPISPFDDPFSSTGLDAVNLEPFVPTKWYGDRGVFAGGESSGTSTSNEMGYVAIASKSNASDFGNLTQGRHGLAGTSNGTRNICWW